MHNHSLYLGLALAGLLIPRAYAAPSINRPNLTPASLIVSQSTVVTGSCQINLAANDPTLIAGGVNLVRLTDAGAVVSILGVMHDDGLSGDAAANDGVYTLQFTANETSSGQFQLQCTAAFQGLLQRVKSSAATVGVSIGTGGIATPVLVPSAIPYGTPTTIVISAQVSGGTPDDGSVLLQRLDSSGRMLAIAGTLHDDGLNGDVTANDGIFTLQTTFNEFAVGPIPLRVAATFSGAVNHVFSPTTNLTVTGTPPPTVTITSPVNLAYLSLSPTTVTGKVSDPGATLSLNSIPAAVTSDGSFSATVPFAEGPTILTATATSASGLVGTASLEVFLDTTPPHVTITSPANHFVTSATSVSVAGNVNDIVVGTVNSQQAQVTVNGHLAQVANRTFLATDVLLAPGANTIQAVAVDRAGNSATTQITVTRQDSPSGGIRVVSGNNQTGTIGKSLNAPLVVSLTDESGRPAANKQVIFSVTQNDGMLATAGGTAAASVLATSDAQGNATVSWTLGMRSGAGSDAVQAYSVGLNGTAVFTATANQSTPGMIVIDTGNNQTGAVNQALPKPLIAVVTDEGHNRLANVPVTFTVQQGGGSFQGQPSLTVNTDSDGRAAAILSLGFQEGNSNNLVSADFPGDSGYPASFTASGLGPGDPVKTVISGIVLDNSNQPVPGVTIRAVLTNALNASMLSVQTAATATTDDKGQFSIYRAPVGYVKLMIDGSTAKAPGSFPNLEYDLVTVAGQINTVGQSIYLLPIKTDNKLCINGSTGGGTLTIPEAPGFSLTFAPGQVTFPGGSKDGCVSVTIVHPDKVPMVPGFGQQPRFIVTIQPAGAIFNPPAPITIPNVDGLKPREVTEMYSYDHDISSFVAIGTGTVSDDGKIIRSSFGIGVLKAGWHCGGNSQAIGTAANCPVCQWCQDPSGGGQPGGSCVTNSRLEGTNCDFTIPPQKRNLNLFCGPHPIAISVENQSPKVCVSGSCQTTTCNVSRVSQSVISALNALCNSMCVPADLDAFLIGRLTGTYASLIADCQSITSGLDCGQSPFGLSEISMFPQAFTTACSGSGDGSDVAFHEIMHLLSGKNHKDPIDWQTDAIYGCEKACFPNSPHTSNPGACTLAALKAMP